MLAKAFLGSVLHVFVDPFIVGNSAYAHFIGKCMLAWSGGVDLALVQLTSGTREGIVLSEAEYDTDHVTMSWGTDILGNGDAGDAVICAIFDASYLIGFSDATAIRSDGTVDVTVGTGRTAAMLFCYAFVADDPTTPTVVSPSDYHVTSLP